jgi:hypothetical protein
MNEASIIIFDLMSGESPKQETDLINTEALINFIGDRYLGYTNSIASLAPQEKAEVSYQFTL